MPDKKKVVVAFSGGLDTSYTVMKLSHDMGYEVYAACANTGGFSPEQLKKNEENAYKLGAKEYVTLDVTHEYYEKSLKYMIFGNVLRNNCYPISVSSERIFQAIAIARYAKQIGADAIAHGSTGAGNDQIRFDMTFLVQLQRRHLGNEYLRRRAARLGAGSSGRGVPQTRDPSRRERAAHRVRQG